MREGSLTGLLVEPGLTRPDCAPDPVPPIYLHRSEKSPRHTAPPTPRNASGSRLSRPYRARISQIFFATNALEQPLTPQHIFCVFPATKVEKRPLPFLGDNSGEEGICGGWLLRLLGFGWGLGGVRGPSVGSSTTTPSPRTPRMLLGDRTYKLGSDTTSEYGRYVKYPGGGP